MGSGEWASEGARLKKIPPPQPLALADGLPAASAPELESCARRPLRAAGGRRLLRAAGGEESAPREGDAAVGRLDVDARTAAVQARLEPAARLLDFLDGEALDVDAAVGAAGGE